MVAGGRCQIKLGRSVPLIMIAAMVALITVTVVSASLMGSRPSPACPGVATSRKAG
jgi:hypothetical protein